ncbi:MAG: type II secretion system inner membrane protein GspF [Bdellovibrionaceae bacterium]|nr:type II secretion system inner membrane protein GspF [Pseudobdellovibrionaceae bacterium]
MPIFEYKGINKQGRTVKGQTDAENIRAARLKLKKDGIFASEIKDKTKKKSKGSTATGSNAKVNIQDLSQTTRQLATLLKASIPLVEALGAVAEQSENQKLKLAFADIRNFVNEGGSFYKGLLKYPKIFNKIYVSMCEAGEMSGTLDVILIRLAEFLEAQHELSSKVKSAMIYPSIMISFTILVMIGLFVFLVPKMREVFDAEEGLELPWISQVVFNLSDFVVANWLGMLILIGITVAIFISWKRTPKGEESWDAIVLNLPVIGKLARIIAVSRFTRTLSTLLAGGVPMLNSLAIVRNVVNNEVLAKAVDKARENIREGESIAGPLKKSGQFPPIVIHMINVGEKTGELENMLNQVSDAYDFQVKNEIEGLTSLLEPVMLIMMGGVIAIVVFSIIVPMFEMQNFAG